MTFGLEYPKYAFENEKAYWLGHTKEEQVTEWKKARKTAISEYREARPADEGMIRRREGEALFALGIDEGQPVHPHYLIMRGGEGEEYPISCEVFRKTYEPVEERPM